MHLRRQDGQAMILAIMCIGVIMATIVIYGSKRVEDMSKVVNKLDNSQAAYEALAAAAKRVQYIYANESGCDPETLDARLSALTELPASPAALGGLSFNSGDLAYAIAQPSLASPQKENRCTGGSGCRQFAIPIDTFLYIVTAGSVSRDSDIRTGDCPRDASVRLSVAVNKNVYFQRVTLTNICSIAACDTDPPTGAGGRGFSGISLTLSGAVNTAACTGANSNIPIRKYGGGFTEAVATNLTTNDLRWARRFLETGGEGVGETNYLYTTDGLIAAGNGSCSEALSASQCQNKNCFPAFDLNRDRTNNDADLAILENFLRGYINSLPVNELN